MQEGAVDGGELRWEVDEKGSNGRGNVCVIAKKPKILAHR
jgi:hypothetical protein